MHESLLILGRQPALGLAELESLFGAEAVSAVGQQAARVHVEAHTFPFTRLGGSTKLCEILTTLPTTSWDKLERLLVEQAAALESHMPEGKVTIGLSVIGMGITPARVGATGLTLKKQLRKTGRSIRLVPNQSLALNSAQVIHNHLTGPNGIELVIVGSGSEIIIARTIAEQDIESYTVRDRERPKRDPRVGMLPPKLAQTIINLSTGPVPAEKPQLTILDPFCGTGVVLQEALLMGYRAYGSDLEQRMVDYSQQNLDWLSTIFQIPASNFFVEKGDATAHHWDFSRLESSEAGVSVACETYLGRPFTTAPSREVLAQTVGECNLIITKFLRTIAPQIPSGTRFCLAVPAWQIRKNEFRHLPLIDQISDFGYNRIRFEHVRDEDLLYYREDQTVARQLLVLTKI